jgi:hypothetical protein
MKTTRTHYFIAAALLGALAFGAGFRSQVANALRLLSEFLSSGH